MKKKWKQKGLFIYKTKLMKRVPPFPVLYPSLQITKENYKSTHFLLYSLHILFPCKATLSQALNRSNKTTFSVRCRNDRCYGPQPLDSKSVFKKWTLWPSHGSLNHRFLWFKAQTFSFGDRVPRILPNNGFFEELVTLLCGFDVGQRKSKIYYFLDTVAFLLWLFWKALKKDVLIYVLAATEMNVVLIFIHKYYLWVSYYSWMIGW